MNSLLALAIAGQAFVIDGDTIAIDHAKIRLADIDAPEMGQLCADKNQNAYDCGETARRVLSEATNNQEVTCEVSDYDKYNRAVATCSTASLQLNEYMVSSGWAIVNHRYSQTYATGEQAAKDSHAGVWQGEFDPPWQWRREHH